MWLPSLAWSLAGGSVITICASQDLTISEEYRGKVCCGIKHG
mgnify:CR=1 FL=1